MNGIKYILSTCFLVYGLFSIFVTPANAQYEDLRCKCVCPSTEVVNGTHSDRKLYIGNVVPNDCNCDGVILPQVAADIKAKAKEFCPRCTCKYESRNTTVIKVVVVIIIGILSLLVLYMLFLMCLEPMIAGKGTAVRGDTGPAYEEHTDEEVNLDDQESFPAPERTSSSVFNRVGLQTTRWKQTVQEQRRHIYDRHTMLN